jgi:hypothetical protein
LHDPHTVARFRWTPVIAYMVFIFALSSISNPPSLPEGSDKDLHALLYAGLGLVLARALTGAWRRRLTPGMALLAVLIAGLYGVSSTSYRLEVPMSSTSSRTRSAPRLQSPASTRGPV